MKKENNFMKKRRGNTFREVICQETKTSVKRKLHPLFIRIREWLPKYIPISRTRVLAIWDGGAYKYLPTGWGDEPTLKNQWKNIRITIRNRQTNRFLVELKRGEL